MTYEPKTKDKRALVTGGSRGIGAAIVKEAQALGVKSVAIQADSADAGAVVVAVERTVAEFDGIDILVNNAGVAALAPLADFTLADFDRTLAINVRAVFVATQAA